MSQSNKNKQKKKRNVFDARTKWTDEMEKSILEYSKSRFLEGKDFEKPTAPEFYRSFLKTAEGFEGVSLEKLVQHMRAIRKSFALALQWRNATGQGILDTDAENGAETVRAELLKKCKYYDELNEMLGEKPQFNPPFLHHSSTAPKTDPEVEKEEVPSLPNEEMQTRPKDELNTLDIKTATKRQSVSSCAISLKKRIRGSPSRSGAGALESAIKCRVEADDKRLQWEKECHEQELSDRKMLQQSELDLKNAQFDFEKSKWKQEVEDRRNAENRNYELEKLKIEKEAELSRLKMERDFELEKLRIQSNSK